MWRYVADWLLLDFSKGCRNLNFKMGTSWTYNGLYVDALRLNVDALR